MKHVLPDSLHARPAALLVRAASRYAATIEIIGEFIGGGGRRADAKNILQVLALGAKKGDTVELSATGDDADDAVATLGVLIDRRFDPDLVPETGLAAVEGVAIGRALVLSVRDTATAAATPTTTPTDTPTDTANDALAGIRSAFAKVRREVEALLRTLPAVEAALFEPELQILGELETSVVARVGRGESAAEAVAAEAPSTGPELIADASARLLDALVGAHSDVDALERAPDGDLILVTDALTPSRVVAVAAHLVGVVASGDAGFTSHAAILAHGRGLPLIFVPPHVAASIEPGETLVVDTTGATPRLWISPSASRLAEAVRARDERLGAVAASEARARTVAGAGVRVEVRVNIGSVHEPIPDAAAGIGLLRTEFLFAHERRAPGALRQRWAIASIAERLGAQRPLVVRLFDAGGDKPLSWLPPPADAPGVRGIELLRRHPDVLDAQLDALAKVAAHANLQVLLPFVRGAGDIAAVRTLTRGIPIGAMVETPDAVQQIDQIAAAADFICIGTNDLTAAVLGVDRTAAAALVDARVIALVANAIEGAHRARRTVTVCGELASEERGAYILAGLGVDAISVPPPRVVPIKLALAAATDDDCRNAAEAARRP